MVVGLGALFALAMMAVTALMRKGGNIGNAEEFTVAKRSLGIGLTAAGVTSSWTWSTTLLSSATVAYEYGVAGSFFYAACNSTQIMIFSNLAIESKRKAPYVSLTPITPSEIPEGSQDQTIIRERKVKSSVISKLLSRLRAVVLASCRLGRSFHAAALAVRHTWILMVTTGQNVPGDHSSPVWPTCPPKLYVLLLGLEHPRRFIHLNRWGGCHQLFDRDERLRWSLVASTQRYGLHIERRFACDHSD